MPFPFRHNQRSVSCHSKCKLTSEIYVRIQVSTVELFEDTMASRRMRLRSGRLVGLPPPPPPAPAAPPPPIPPGPPAQNTLMGLPLPVRQAVLQAVFQGQPRMDLEDLLRPQDLGNLCLVNHQLKAEAEEAFFAVSSFEVTILTSIEDAWIVQENIDWGQQFTVQPAHPWNMTLQEYRYRVARAQRVWPSQRSVSWGRNAVIRVLVFTSNLLLREILGDISKNLACGLIAKLTSRHLGRGVLENSLYIHAVTGSGTPGRS